MNEKCRLCGSYQFNLHQEGIDQGELCDVHYWKVLALKGRDIAKLAWDFHLAVVSYSRVCMLDDAPEVIDALEKTMDEAFHKMDVAIYEFNSHSHTI